MSDRSPEWILASQRLDKTVVVALFSFGDNTKDLALSSAPINLEGREYLPLIINIPERVANVDYWTRVFSVSDTTISILNQPFEGTTRFSDLLDQSGADNNRGYANRRVLVKLWRPGVPTFEKCQSLFTGIFKQPTYDADSVDVNLQDESTLSLDITLDKVRQSDAANTTLGLPDGSRGKIKPIIGGNHIFHRGDNSKSVDTVSALNNAVPMEYLGMNTSGRHEWLVSRYQVDEINTDTDETDQQQIWGVDKDINRRVRLATEFIVEQNDENGCIISLPNNPSYYDYWYPLTASASEGGGGPVTGFSISVKRVADGDFDTKAVGSLDAGAVAGSFIRATVSYSAYDNQDLDDSQIIGVRGKMYAKTTEQGPGTGDYSPSLDSGIYPDTRVAAGLFSNTLASIGDSLELDFEVVADFAVGFSVDVEAYMSYKEIEYAPRKRLDLLFGGKGGRYGDWINNRGTADGFIVAHVDDGLSASLIQNRAGLIEYYLRDVLGVATAQINEESFNLASTILAGVDGSYSISDIESVDTLQELFILCQNYACFMWWDASGKISIRALPDTITDTDLDFVIDGDLITDLKYKRTPTENLYTLVDVEYAGVGTKDKGLTLQVEDTDAQEWYAVTGIQSQLRFPSIGYRTLEDASLFPQFNIRQITHDI